MSQSDLKKRTNRRPPVRGTEPLAKLDDNGPIGPLGKVLVHIAEGGGGPGFGWYSELTLYERTNGWPVLIHSGDWLEEGFPCSSDDDDDDDENEEGSPEAAEGAWVLEPKDFIVGYVNPKRIGRGIAALIRMTDVYGEISGEAKYLDTDRWSGLTPTEKRLIAAEWCNGEKYD
jgi:hypothetical protein